MRRKTDAIRVCDGICAVCCVLLSVHMWTNTHAHTHTLNHPQQARSRPTYTIHTQTETDRRTDGLACTRTPHSFGLFQVRTAIDLALTIRQKTITATRIEKRREKHGDERQAFAQVFTRTAYMGESNVKKGTYICSG